MINTRRPRWYHSFMPSFGFQLAVVFACIVITCIQLVIYSGLEKDIVVFEGECTYETVMNDAGEPTSSLQANCGEHTFSLAAYQERLVHYRELTTGERPAIVCVKTVSEYLKHESVSCTIDPQPEETEEP